jgi:hypothetical protein
MSRRARRNHSAAFKAKVALAAAKGDGQSPGTAQANQLIPLLRKAQRYFSSSDACAGTPQAPLIQHRYGCLSLPPNASSAAPRVVAYERAPRDDDWRDRQQRPMSDDGL